MSATARLLSGLVAEVLVVPRTDDSGYAVALVLGDVYEDAEGAEVAADDFQAVLSEAWSKTWPRRWACPRRGWWAQLARTREDPL